MVFLLTAISMPVKASSLLDESKQLNSGQYQYYSFSGTKGVNIQVNFTESSGGAVNVLLMDSGNYSLFSSDCSNGGTTSFYYYVAGSSLQTLGKSYSFTLPETQTYYVVIDNGGCVSGGATPSGSVSFHIVITGNSTSSSPGFELPMFLGATLLVSALYLMKRKTTR